MYVKFIKCFNYLNVKVVINKHIGLYIVFFCLCVIYMYACVHICIYVYYYILFCILTKMYILINVGTHVYTYVDTHAYMTICIHKYIRLYTCMQ